LKLIPCPNIIFHIYQYLKKLFLGVYFCGGNKMPTDERISLGPNRKTDDFLTYSKFDNHNNQLFMDGSISFDSTALPKYIHLTFNKCSQNFLKSL
jgi:hypothetical protein